MVCGCGGVVGYGGGTWVGLTDLRGFYGDVAEVGRCAGVMDSSVLRLMISIPQVPALRRWMPGSDGYLRKDIRGMKCRNWVIVWWRRMIKLMEEGADMLDGKTSREMLRNAARGLRNR